MLVQRKWKTLLCACVCVVSKRNNVSLRAQFFLLLRCQGLSTFIVASVVNLNGLFVALSHQILPSSCITCDAHTSATRKHNWGEMSVVFQSLFSFSSRCFEQHLSVLLLSFYPLAPRFFFPMILLWTPPHAKLLSPLGATSVPLCMVAGLKL